MALGLGGSGGGNYPWNPIYGGRVPSIGTPAAPTGPSLNNVYPNLSGTNAAASGALLNELTGQLSPETQANIQNAAASWGVSAGMPGSGLMVNRGLRDIGLTTEQLQHQGLQDYQGLIPAVTSTQTLTPEQQAQLQSQNQNLAAEIAAMNATNKAAPDPASAGTYAQELFQKYLDQMSAPAGGAGGSNPLFGGNKPWWAPANATEFVVPGAAGGGRGSDVFGRYF